MTILADHVRLDVTGEWTPGKEVEEIKNTLGAVADACRENGLERMLAVFDMGGRIPIGVAYEVAKDPSSVGWERHFRGALVHRDEERYESNLFTETVAVNRSFNIKAFNDEGAALKWLLES